MYCGARACLSWRMQPPARTTMRTLLSPVGEAKSSVETCRIARIKRLAGTPNPRSWKETKLTTYPGGGDRAAPLGGAIHSGCEPPERGRSKPSATRASRSSAVTVEKVHGSRGETMVTRSTITKQKRWQRKELGVRFSFSGFSLGLRKPKWEASSRVKNRHRSLS
jgi:hypothetical protein